MGCSDRIMPTQIHFNWPAAKMYDWAVEKFGPPGRHIKVWWYLCSNYVFYKEEDATLFLLKWGGTVVPYKEKSWRQFVLE